MVPSADRYEDRNLLGSGGSVAGMKVLILESAVLRFLRKSSFPKCCVFWKKARICKVQRKSAKISVWARFVPFVGVAVPAGVCCEILG